MKLVEVEPLRPATVAPTIPPNDFVGGAPQIGNPSSPGHRQATFPDGENKVVHATS
jgi:hypothetical protein